MHRKRWFPDTREHDKIVDYLLDALREWGAYLYYEATTGSRYIKFPHWALGSIRVGDHNGIQKYRYRWRIRTDKPGDYERLFKDSNVWVFECGAKKLDRMIEKFVETARHRGLKPGDSETYDEYERRTK